MWFGETFVSGLGLFVNPWKVSMCRKPNVLGRLALVGYSRYEKKDHNFTML